MSQIFWETYHRARISHFCTRCFGYIEAGEKYQRMAWRPRRDQLVILKQHEWCEYPEDPDNEDVFDEMEGCEVISLEIKVVAVLKMQINGQTIVEHETIVVPTIISEDSWGDSEDDIPF